MREGFKRFLAVFLALFFVGIGAALLCLESHNLTKANHSVSWSSTDGIILHTDYERSSVGRKLSNAPYVTYRYQVQGESYISSVRSFGDGLSSAEVFEQYPSGRGVTVYYDPENPQEATLVKGVGSRTATGVRYAQRILVLGLVILAYVAITEMKKLGNSQQGAPSAGEKPPN